MEVKILNIAKLQFCTSERANFVLHDFVGYMDKKIWSSLARDLATRIKL